MCELLGLVFNLEVDFNISFKEFRQRGKSNDDGWGVAFFPDGRSSQVLKEATKAPSSKLADFLQDPPYIRSKIILAHVRYASGTDVAHRNTHPFCRELNGKEYVFAHNGVLRSNYEQELVTGRYKPVGETDSEYLFCHILNLISEREVGEWAEADYSWLRETLKELNDMGSINCLLSDGERLFCYHDENSSKGLSYLRRQSPFGQIRLEDEDFRIDLSEEKRPNERGFIVATQQLTNEAWVDFKPGELIVFKDGEMVFSD